jgi:membrane-bound serine protease (ClpP class)
MDAFVVVALVGVGLLVAELLLPTGGVLAVLGVLGLIAGGVLALTADSGSTATDIAGPALIAVGILSGITFYFVTRKVIAAHRDSPVRTGREEMIGSSAEARSSIDPEGQAWADGSNWSARLADGASPARPGDRVVIEAIEGLTLIVRPGNAQQPAEEGTS